MSGAGAWFAAQAARRSVERVERSYKERGEEVPDSFYWTLIAIYVVSIVISAGLLVTAIWF